ncbi:hypothetical protein FB451DRAFT_1167658 [Mycena latifolia]|nr:hypothetical protein FB451DRAFT_1167658 [Mycena latifolia]
MRGAARNWTLGTWVMGANTQGVDGTAPDTLTIKLRHFHTFWVLVKGEWADHGINKVPTVYLQFGRCPSASGSSGRVEGIVTAGGPKSRELRKKAQNRCQIVDRLTMTYSTVILITLLCGGGVGHSEPEFTIVPQHAPDTQWMGHRAEKLIGSSNLGMWSLVAREASKYWTMELRTHFAATFLGQPKGTKSCGMVIKTGKKVAANKIS